MKIFKNTRLLLSGIVLTGLILIFTTIAIVAFEDEDTVEDTLAQLSDSDDECVVCHSNHTPGIVNQYGQSDHFKNNVSCADCHEVEEGYAGAVQHPEAEFYVLPSSSPAKCETCHRQQVQEFNLSRHALPAYIAYAGTDGLSEEHLALYESIPEGGAMPGGRERNSLHAMEGPEITRFACETCHNIGKPNEDGSVGDCTTCHLRHEFNLEQARKPETCNACHIGPDHPQWEIYQESPHGIAYMTLGHEWNWEAEPGTLTVVDFPAPTCATCHMSGFGLSATTHDVGDRLTWFLAAKISEPRPNASENRIRMQNVCLACHSSNFVEDFYSGADLVVDAVNDWVRLSDALVAPLKENGLMTPAPFDEPIDYVYFNIWHHWGRTAKFGAWMQGADYVQWHGAYEIMHDLSELREMVDAKLEAAGLEPLDLPENFPSIDAARQVIGEDE
ncbi:MAG: nitrate reductase [Phototrophicales bacterium]|nr:MAG: nitrate reductase [Phototrophicales bacterium]